MKADNLLASVLSDASLKNIAEALEVRQWRLVKTIGEKFSIWEKGEQKIYVPARQDFSDYSLRIREIAQELDGNEANAILDILTKFKDAYFDTIRIRVDNCGEIEGAIKVEKAKQLYDGGHLLLVASANTAFEKRAIYRGKISAKVHEYIDSVMAGQTEIGSFVAKFYSPLPRDLARFEGFEAQTTFERTVTESLVTSVNRLGEAISKYKIQRKQGIFSELVQEGISANLCEAALELTESSSFSDVEIDVSWSKILPTQILGKAVIQKNDSRYLAEAAGHLRSFEDLVFTEIEGYVTDLRKEYLTSLGRGIVLITARMNGVYRKVLVELSEQEHSEAIHAYENNQKVTISGKLRKKSKHWRLEDIGKFSIL